MKLSKSLLSAIMIGIVVETTVVSCSKDDNPKPKEKKEQPEKVTPLDGCPACGMG